MNWVLLFPRARDVYDKMVDGKVWSNEKAIALTTDRLRKLGLIQPLATRFNLSSRSVQDQHDLHVNYREVEYSYFHLDDLTAALGNFSIYVTPLVGEVLPVIGGSVVKLHQVGFHVMDSYDFQGDQFLGTWDESTNSASFEEPVHYEGDPDWEEGDPPWHGAVYNFSFRDWRTANRKGGDFLVYSDVQVLKRNPPDSFMIWH